MGHFVDSMPYLGHLGPIWEGSMPHLGHFRHISGVHALFGLFEAFSEVFQHDFSHLRPIWGVVLGQIWTILGLRGSMPDLDHFRPILGITCLIWAIWGLFWIVSVLG